MKRGRREDGLERFRRQGHVFKAAEVKLHRASADATSRNCGEMFSRFDSVDLQASLDEHFCELPRPTANLEDARAGAQSRAFAGGVDQRGRIRRANPVVLRSDRVELGPVWRAQSAFSRMVTARAHSSSVGTSAKRT